MADMLKSKIGEEIRRLRRDAGLTQEDLASEAELHTNHISLVERGRTNVTVEAASKIVKVFGLTLTAFFARIEE